MSDTRLSAPEIELAILGAAIKFSRQAVSVLKSIGCASNWFTSDSHRQMWETIVSKDGDLQPIDPNLMETYIRERHGWSGADIIQRCIAKCPDLTNIHAWGNVLVEMLRKRDLNSTLLNGQNMLTTEATAGQIAVAMRNELNQLGTSKDAGGKSVILAQIRADLEDDRSVEKDYIKSYLPFINESIHGWFRGQPVTLGADPKTGKTTWLLQELVMGAIRGKPRGIVSIEMKAQQVMYLAAGILSGVDCFRLKTKQANQEEKTRFREALMQLEEAPFHIIDTAQDTNQVLAAYYDLSLTHGCELVGIDYFQLARQAAGTGKQKEKNRFEGFSDFSNALVCGAKDIGNTPLILSQLRKEGNTRGQKRDTLDSEPTQHDLDGTQSLARDSHTVILMSRVKEPKPELPENQSEVMFNIVLNRGGKTPRIPLTFVMNEQRFVRKGDLYLPGER